MLKAFQLRSHDMDNKTEFWFFVDDNVQTTDAWGMYRYTGTVFNTEDGLILVGAYVEADVPADLETLMLMQAKRLDVAVRTTWTHLPNLNQWVTVLDDSHQMVTLDGYLTIMQSVR